MKGDAIRLSGDALRIERLLPGPLERVWAFLTDSDQRARWLAAGEFEIRAGGRIELRFDHSTLSAEPTPRQYADLPMSFTGRMLRCEPPRLLEFTWMENAGNYTQVLWELEPRGADVLLRITHTRIPNRAELLDIAGGWDVHTGILDDVLHSRVPRLFWTEHARRALHYDATFTD